MPAMQQPQQLLIYIGILQGLDLQISAVVHRGVVGEHRAHAAFEYSLQIGLAIRLLCRGVHGFHADVALHDDLINGGYLWVVGE